MTQLLLTSGLLLELAHRTAAFTEPAIVLHTDDATGGFPVTDTPP